MRTCAHCSGDLRQGTTCPTCGASLPAAPVAWRRPLLSLLGCLGLLVVLLAIAVPAFLSSGRASSERNASASLKTLATAEADFRANDRDGNGINDFWTGDVAGLYCISPGAGRASDPARAIKLIEISVAGADSDPLRAPGDPYGISIRAWVEASPKAGYWYWALRGDGTETPPAPYRTDTHGTPNAGGFYNTSRFGFLAYPDRPSVAKVAFMINEANRMIRKSCDSSVRPGSLQPPGAVTHPAFRNWPSELDQRSAWRSMD